jgi:hypothetical protein
MGKFQTDLLVRQSAQMDGQGVDSGRGDWSIAEPLVYLADSGITYTVPVGFKTDFASVPRIPLIFDALGDRANLAAALHDWLYSVGPDGKHPVPDRETADKLLREAAIAQGVSTWVADALYEGVRIGGGSHWV